MNAAPTLLDAISQLGHSIWELLTALLAVAIPWTPLIAWVVFWMFAVNWVKLRELLARGGWLGLALIGAIMVLVWGSVSPAAGSIDFFGLHVSNFVEKTVYVSGLFVIMFLAGAVQLSGCCSACCQFDEPIQIDEAHGHAAAGGGHEAGHAAAGAHH